VKPIKPATIPPQALKQASSTFPPAPPTHRTSSVHTTLTPPSSPGSARPGTALPLPFPTTSICTRRHASRTPSRTRPLTARQLHDNQRLPSTSVSQQQQHQQAVS